MTDSEDKNTERTENTSVSANSERPAVDRQSLPTHYFIYLEEMKEGEPVARHRLNKGRTLIGRRQADIVYDDPLISRKHAAVEIYNENYILVRDLASTNGTFVNDHLIHQAKLLDGDVVRVGKIKLRLTIIRGADGG